MGPKSQALAQNWRTGRRPANRPGFLEGWTLAAPAGPAARASHVALRQGWLMDVRCTFQERLVGYVKISPFIAIEHCGDGATPVALQS